MQKYKDNNNSRCFEYVLYLRYLIICILDAQGMTFVHWEAGGRGGGSLSLACAL